MASPSTEAFIRERVATAGRFVPSSQPYIRDAHDAALPTEHRLRCAHEGYAHTFNALFAAYVAVLTADAAGGPELDDWRRRNQTLLSMARDAFPDGVPAHLRPAAATAAPSAR